MLSSSIATEDESKYLVKDAKSSPNLSNLGCISEIFNSEAFSRSLISFRKSVTLTPRIASIISLVTSFLFARVFSNSGNSLLKKFSLIKFTLSSSPAKVGGLLKNSVFLFFKPAITLSIASKDFWTLSVCVKVSSLPALGILVIISISCSSVFCLLFVELSIFL